MRSDERGSPIKSDSHAESNRNDRGFLRRSENLSPATTWATASPHGVDSNFVAALLASSRLNVFDSGRDLPRLATTVCIPGSVGRLAHRGFGIRRYLFRFSQFDLRTTFGLGLQCLWLTRFARCDHSGDYLQRASVYGTSLLDPGVLGSCFIGYPLHHIH